MFINPKKVRIFANHYPPYMKTRVGGVKWLIIN